MNNGDIQGIIEHRFDELNAEILTERNNVNDTKYLEKLHIRRDEVAVIAGKFGCHKAVAHKVWVESGVFKPC
jgi:hypothetical protein